MKKLNKMENQIEKKEEKEVVENKQQWVDPYQQVLQNMLRENFNEQEYPYHTLHPHGRGKLIYKDGDTILEEYEGEFEAGQYHGKGTLVDRHGEVLEGKFAKNKFIG